MRNIIYVCFFVVLISVLSIYSYDSSYNKKEISHKRLINSEVTKSPKLNENPIEEEIENTNSSCKRQYHYTVMISNAHRDWDTYEQQEMINGEVRLRKTSPDVSYLNGYYEWDSDIYLPDENAMFNYICDNYEVMKFYKISSNNQLY